MPVGAPKPWSFAIAIFGVVVCFVAATVFSQQQEQAIGDSSQSIATNAMSSIEHLAAVRAELRQMQLFAVDYASHDGDRRTAALAKLATARENVDHDMHAYLALPEYPGEAPLSLDARSAIHRVDRAMRALQREVE